MSSWDMLHLCAIRGQMPEWCDARVGWRRDGEAGRSSVGTKCGWWPYELFFPEVSLPSLKDQLKSQDLDTIALVPLGLYWTPFCRHCQAFASDLVSSKINNGCFLPLLNNTKPLTVLQASPLQKYMLAQQINAVLELFAECKLQYIGWEANIKQRMCFWWSSPTKDHNTPHCQKGEN